MHGAIDSSVAQVFAVVSRVRNRWRWTRVGVCVAIVVGLAWTVSGLSGGHDTIVG